MVNLGEIRVAHLAAAGKAMTEEAEIATTLQHEYWAIRIAAVA
jgi:hypothetical protein